MKKEDFAFIGCRLMALYWAVEAIHSASSFFAMGLWQINLYESDPTVNLIPLLLTALIVLFLWFGTALIALFLWFGAAPITRFLLPASTEKSPSDKVTLRQAQSIAFAAIGVLILSNALPQITGMLYQIYSLSQKDAQFSAYLQPQMAGLVCQLLLGILLLFGSRGLSGLLHYLRNAGLKQPSP